MKYSHIKILLGRRSLAQFTLFILVLPHILPLSRSEGENQWWLGSASELGSICESDHDGIGQHLGCKCKTAPDNDVLLEADCSKKWIGFNDTLLLPPGVNVSKLVRSLDLSENYLKKVDLNTFSRCESVQTLILSDNMIETFEGVNCPRLIRLDLKNNFLRNLTSAALSNLDRLVELDLSFNRLLWIEPSAIEQLHNLRILYLGSNLLGREVFYQKEYMLSLDNLEKLEWLDLSNSSLLDFPTYLLNGTRHLKKLNLKNNLIQFIASGVFEQMGELTDLDLSGNVFDEIVPNQFLGLKRLRSLTLDKMRQLKTIREHAFAGLSHLHELSCQMNHHLTYIHAQAFHGDPSLESFGSTDSHPKIVRLGDNDLRFIEYPLLVWNTLEALELHRNNWVCDCNLQWVSDFYRHKPKDAYILGDSYFSCFEPHIFAGVPVVAVNPEEMLCFSPAATVAGTIGIVIFGILLFSFCSVIILNQMGMLPEWVRQYNIFGSGSNLPTYTRVHPRPNTKARRIVERVQAIPDIHCYNNNHTTSQAPVKRDVNGEYLEQEPPIDELEWDNTDFGKS